LSLAFGKIAAAPSLQVLPVAASSPSSSAAVVPLDFPALPAPASSHSA
jgi:hypothetical protein